MGSCELFMPVVFRGAAIGAVLALVVQAQLAVKTQKWEILVVEVAAAAR